MLLLQIHATIPTNSKSLMEEGIRKHLEVFMANQEKLGVGPEEVRLLLETRQSSVQPTGKSSAQPTRQSSAQLCQVDERRKLIILHSRHSSTPASCLMCPSSTAVVDVIQADVRGPSVAYVDDAAAMAAQLKELLPSLQHVLADVLHVMKRVFETLAPHHSQDW